MEEMLIVVDREDRVLGYAPRSECHQGNGLLHRAICVALFDSGGRLLLQDRHNGLWDGYWDVTGATHPLHAERDESYEEAARRCLRVEWGIEAEVEPVEAFVYFEREGDYCENERCMLMVARYDGPANPNPAHSYGHRWLHLPDVVAWAAREPEAFTPWARISLRVLGRPS